MPGVDHHRTEEKIEPIGLTVELSFGIRESGRVSRKWSIFVLREVRYYFITEASHLLSLRDRKVRYCFVCLISNKAKLCSPACFFFFVFLNRLLVNAIARNSCLVL